MARKLDYAQVDVFAEQALEGNMLAIFTDASGLTTEQMQALARETNLSETTFILPADDAAERRDGVRVRIFTTEEELPFAGHPTLGTAAWLHLHHPALRGETEIRLRLNSGTVPVRFAPGQQQAHHGVFGTMRQADPVFGAIYPHDEIAGVLGLPLEALDVSRPVQTVSTGMPFCIVPFRSVQALGALATSPAQTRAWLERSDAKFFFCIAPVEQGDKPDREDDKPDRAADFHTRMQFYQGEDPATGSASGCAISYLVRHGLVPSAREIVFRQGLEIGRPSRIHVSARLAGDAAGGCVTDVFVAGRTIPVAEGRFFLA